jgi:excisionase family DNA binding protein
MTTRALTPAQVADYLTCSKTHVYALIRDGSLRAFSIGRNRGLRVTQDEVNRWVAEKQESHTSQVTARSAGADARPLRTIAMKQVAGAG